MFQTLRNAWTVTEVRKKIIFTFLMVLVFRLGSTIPLPFLTPDKLQQIMQGNQAGILELLDLMTGGNLSRMNIFALSIYPYITASIIIQLLTIAFPRLGEIAKDGEEGKKKIGKYTKIGSVILGFVEGYAIVRTGLAADATAMQIIVTLTALVAGTMFLVWLGEAITEKGVGNGISILIFLGIISNFPKQIAAFSLTVRSGQMDMTRAIITAVLIVIASILIVFAVVALNQGERKIPVSYAKRVVGRKMYGGQSTHIPMKVNMAGVMPVIFASSLVALPSTLMLFFGKQLPHWYTEYLTVNGKIGIFIYSLIYLLLIIVFAYFYTAIQFNTVEYAKNLQQYGGFIPGIRPGKPTGEYLQRISNRVTFIGAISLALIASAPTLLGRVSGIRIMFGSTSVIIVVGVVIETIKQLESMLMMRHYKGFLNK